MPPRKNTPSKYRTFSNDTIIIAYRQSNYHLGKTAKLLGMSRAFFIKLMASQPGLSDVLEDDREYILDTTEDELKKLVLAGNFAAIKFLLETVGRDRGYGKALEIAGNRDKPVALIDTTMTPEQASRAYLDTIRPDVDDL